MSEEHERRVRLQAYRIWLDEGRPDGRAVEHWVRAEEEIAFIDRVRGGATPPPSAEPPELGAPPAETVPTPTRRRASAA